MKAKKQDFVQIEYVGKAKETDQIFDLTDAKLAKKMNMPPRGPVIVCLGEGQVLKGLDAALIGKEIGTQYKIELTPEQAFGKKDAKLIKLVPSSLFKKQEVKPFPGMQINIDGLLATVRTVSGGRVIVDFNHPLAGKTIIYKIKMTKKITDSKEKVKAILQNSINKEEPKFELKEGKLKLADPLPKEIQPKLTKKIKELIPTIKSVAYTDQKTSSRT